MVDTSPSCCEYWLFTAHYYSPYSEICLWPRRVASWGKCLGVYHRILGDSLQLTHRRVKMTQPLWLKVGCGLWCPSCSRIPCGIRLSLNLSWTHSMAFPPIPSYFSYSSSPKSTTQFITCTQIPISEKCEMLFLTLHHQPVREAQNDLTNQIWTMTR